MEGVQWVVKGWVGGRQRAVGMSSGSSAILHVPGDFYGRAGASRRATMAAEQELIPTAPYPLPGDLDSF
jgi:hypothetical protein